MGAVVTTPIWQQQGGTRGGLQSGGPMATPPSGGSPSGGARRWLVGAGLGIAAAVAFAATDSPTDLMAGSGPVEARVVNTASALVVRPADAAFGASGELRMRYARAGDAVDFPLAVRGDTRGLTYQWVRMRDTEAGDVERPLVAARALLTPLTPGFYRLVLSRGGTKQLIGEPVLAVMMPFELKFGSYLNGYRIGHYPAEWIGSGEKEKPAGFVEVRGPEDLDLKLSKHLRLRDFLTHDDQATWPRYIALNQRIVDKIELVLAEIGRRRGDDELRIQVRVHSGFRTPAHNSAVEGAARDSRHLYGDAADVAVDADGDGRFTLIDAYNVERAVDWIEKTHPELVGGMGVYSSPRFATPYVHIDTRGERVRWRG
jgi:hypothetical protein